MAYTPVRGSKKARASALASTIRTQSKLDTKSFALHPGGYMPFSPPNATKPLSFCCVRWIQKKSWMCSSNEPLRPPLAPALRARLRDDTHSQQNNGFVSFAYQTLFHSFLVEHNHHITCRPACQLLLRPLPLRRRAYFAMYCWSASA